MPSTFDAHCPDENDLDAFVEGGLEVRARDAVARHAEGCEACQALIAALSRMRGEGAGAALSSATVEHLPALFDEGAPPLEPGTRVGRFSVLAPVGAGGMGVVYAAYDPELDRRVALKFLRSQRGADRSEGPERLIHEAQAMARLAHPGVVRVFDVGEHEGRVYLAMEFVDGRTLSAWCAERPRSVEEVSAMFDQAAAGLSAAHAVGIVHRDFKPDNVVVGWDGRARVTDFGLARRFGHASGVGGAIHDGGQSARAGTPRYMAPEQIEGGRIDERTDQFAFCVALYEALFGTAPFVGRDLHERLAAMHVGEIGVMDGRAIPPRLAAALRRGLRANPVERHSSMAEVRRALAPRRARGGRYVLASLVIAPVLVAAVVAFGADTPDEACLLAGAEVAADWPRSHADWLEEAMRQAGGGPGATGVRRVLDAYAARLGEAAVDACRATRVRQEQSFERLALRRRCLDRRRHSLSATARALATLRPDEAVLALAAARALPSIDDCADPRRLPAAAADDPYASVLLASGIAEASLGRKRLALRYVTRAMELGDGEVAVESALLLGDLLHDVQLASVVIERALESAERLRLDRLAALAAARLAGVTSDPSVARLWARYAQAAAERAGGAAELREAASRAMAATERGFTAPAKGGR